MLTNTSTKTQINEFLVVICCISLDMYFIDNLSDLKSSKKRYQQIYFWSKILSSTLYAMLKLSKTTSPQTDCITLYCG